MNSSLITSVPTLLVFTRGAAGDREQRRLLPSVHSGLETAFHRACLDAALRAGRAAGCRLMVASSATLDLPTDVQRIRQRGHGFGERLRHAMADAEALVDGPLLVVGTDVPDLEAEHLRDALERLRDATAPVVVGPATDGGFYLLASRRPIAHLLGGVHWCRRDTLRTLLDALHQAGRTTARLAPLADLDHRHALERWIAARRPSGLIAAIVRRVRRVLVRLARPDASIDVTAPRTHRATPFAGRAPPVAV